uniref:Uncharacterized protein n=1 Tax=Arundo donax TaxID=35708 RepID=A0A0A9ETU6_ARUDO
MYDNVVTSVRTSDSDTNDHSHRKRGRCRIPRPGDVVPIQGSGSNRVDIPF